MNWNLTVLIAAALVIGGGALYLAFGIHRRGPLVLPLVGVALMAAGYLLPFMAS